MSDKNYYEGKLPQSTKFLLSIDKTTNEMYILHRESPACLIWVKQEEPIRFILLEIYDKLVNEEEIIQMDFVKEAQNFIFDFLPKE